jgi:7-cyano-7-deazaguanine synthase in queuosine biosynthesis
VEWIAVLLLQLQILDYDIAFAHINYGQRTVNRELKSFNEIANHYRVKKRLIIDYTHLAKIGGSSLTDKNIEVTKADLENKKYHLLMFRLEMQTYFQLVLAGLKF